MNIHDLKHQIPTSPAYIFDLDQVKANQQPLLDLRAATGCRVLYSMKALPLAAVLKTLTALDGISASSLFEARLAAQVVGEGASIHLTTPGLRSAEFAELSRLCSHISFNSLSQYHRLSALGSGYSKGLRINPKQSFAADQRYDPCRIHSKLGVDMATLADGLPADIEGLHFHTMFGGLDFQPLLANIASLEPLLQQNPQLRWLNIGGGYLLADIADLTPLITLIRRLQQNYALQVYLEPGNGLVGNAGYLLTTVVDRFESDGKTVLVLDTSINHHPEVFEYQQSPILMDAATDANAKASAILVGSCCLAGDVFGEYRFAQLPDVGDKLVFSNVGAYSLIKANRFNGYNLPDVYVLESGQASLYKQFEYADYQRQWQGAA
jgi:carboxynorspermidine decarboxylase